MEDDDDYIPFEGSEDSRQRLRDWMQTAEGQEFRQRQLERARARLAERKASKAAEE